MTESAAITVPALDEAAQLRAAARDPAGFAALYRRFVDDIYRYLLARCGDPSEAEDLVADTFLAALRAAPGYRGAGPVKAWLVGIARRKAADAYRGRRAHATLEAAAAVADPARTDELALERVELARVLEATGHLGADRAEALRLRYFAGLEFTEIGRLMGRSEAAAKMLVHRALSDLRVRLEDPR
ncbi:MAG TPA: RNA polymerase sigma factor [Candidatus Limnocylindria bacterium]|jgi:RNA polymerase sigma-70 factor (ECF subfamily)|nr:RNA polymerase sigma factor [Candidatus Limnocylindria bacterium]